MVNHSGVVCEQVSAYKALPLNAVSRLWGRIHNVELPLWLRKPILRLYVNYYACNLSEAKDPDLAHYPNLGEFFRRPLREDARSIHPGPCLVSPADGEVLHMGMVESNHVEQVKGLKYPLYAFLGPNTWNNETSSLETPTPKTIALTYQYTTDKPSIPLNVTIAIVYTLEKQAAVNMVGLLFQEQEGESDQQLTDYHQSLLLKGGSLYHCVIYLAPGDYHRFHSPVDWTVTARRHFPGALLSVCRGIASWVPGLFHINERVVYTGEWSHGFFAMAPVGATNVGSIKVYFDEAKICLSQMKFKYEGVVYQDLKTNKKKASRKKTSKKFADATFDNVIMKKGEAFGEFNLGSTIVLVFEAPPGSRFDITAGQKIKYGQKIFAEKSTEEDSCHLNTA
ncbi:PISD [Cordylochernes scorpioides]|uniref:phosphatidylserine decarboxylase n=1 Tax=Cordylochernes scorpioides TaxID=51811 RepID=A0ABY6L996_9ARAC|nr:PISD [Cordylochernes scorpioides]